MALGKDYIKTIIKRGIAINLLAIGISFFLFKNSTPIIYGIVFGGSISLLAFKLLEHGVKKSVTFDENSAKKYMTSNYFVRYIIYGVVLAVAAKADYINLLATVISLFTVKVVILLDVFHGTFGYFLKGKKHT